MDVRRPLSRPFREGMFDPTINDLVEVAVERMYRIVQPDPIVLPPVLFPLAEKMRWDFFTFKDWDEFGDLETEYARLTYTLTTYPERGPPAACGNILKDLLRQDSSILTAWSSIVSHLRAHATGAVNGVVQALRGQVAERARLTKSDFIAVPVDYEPCEFARELTLELWRQSLDEAAAKLVSAQALCESLQIIQIHAYLKDPIYGLAKPLKVQQFYFEALLSKFRSVIGSEPLSRDVWAKVVAQAALESSYLANPLLDKVTFVHFQAHHQLTYVNVPLDSLARAEFGVPLHVLEVVEEMLLAVAANNGFACPLVPILVTTRPTFSNHDRYLVPIIDGNHRVTATLLLRFLGSQPSFDNDIDLMSERLIEYCQSHHLGKKWQIDLLDVVKELYSLDNRRYYDYIRANINLIRKFATVISIPALLVQEEDFHTICKQRSVGKSKPVLLHPFHQTLFNDDDLPFALPQKAGQTHGRPEAFRLLPLVPFGSADDGMATGSAKTFAAALRQSMGGLTQEGDVVVAMANGHEVKPTNMNGVVPV